MTEDEQDMCGAYLVDTGNIDPDAGDVENRQGVLLPRHSLRLLCTEGNAVGWRSQRVRWTHTNRLTVASMPIGAHPGFGRRDS